MTPLQGKDGNSLFFKALMEGMGKSPAFLTSSIIILSLYLSFLAFVWFCSSQWILISRVQAQEVNEPYEVQ